MDALFISISKILDKNARLEVYSELNQHLTTNPSVVLWDKTALSISDEIYEKFKLAINKKSCTFYKLSKVLPYHDFCIALLCTVGYTLNHTTASQISVKTYISAWRSMQVMEVNTDTDLMEWIQNRRQERTSIGYSTELSLNLQNVPSTIRKVSFSKQPTKFSIDEDIIAKACSSRKVKDIRNTDNLTISSIISTVTSLPESQLDNLRVAHVELLEGYF